MCICLHNILVSILSEKYEYIQNCRSRKYDESFVYALLEFVLLDTRFYRGYIQWCFHFLSVYQAVVYQNQNMNI